MVNRIASHKRAAIAPRFDPQNSGRRIWYIIDRRCLSRSFQQHLLEHTHTLSLMDGYIHTVDVPVDSNGSIETNVSKLYDRVMSGVPPEGHSEGTGDQRAAENEREEKEEPLSPPPPMDPRMKRYWCKAIRGGSRAMRDFEANIMQSDEYMQHVLTRYKSAWARILGSDVPFNPKPLKGLRDEVYRVRTIPDAAIREEIRSTPEFTRKYTEIVQSCAFLTLEGVEMPQEDIDQFLDKFRRVPGYNTNSLKTDILSRYSPPPPPLTPLTGADFQLNDSNDTNDSIAAVFDEANANNNDATSGAYDAKKKEEEQANEPNESFEHNKSEPEEERSGDPNDPRERLRALLKSRLNPSQKQPAKVDDVTEYPKGVKESKGTKYTEDVKGMKGMKCTEGTEDAKDAINNPSTESESMKKEPGTSNSEHGTGGNDDEVCRTPPCCWSEEAIRQMLREFFETYGRPMYVQEYRRFCSEGAATPPGHDRFSDEMPVLTRLTNIVRGVYSRYTGRDVTDYEVVDDWLHLLGKPLEEVDSVVTGNLIQSDLYREAMRSKIADTHRALFDAGTHMTEYDSDCVFEIAKAGSLDLVGEELRECVRNFQYQTDRIHSHVCDVYAAVFDRQPDAAELDGATRTYRERMKSEPGIKEENIVPQLDVELECRLVADLEFHDILKRKIKQARWDAKEELLSGRALYDLLRKVLTELASVPPEMLRLERAFEIADKVSRFYSG